jgi:ABC-2 type transport system permease protein
MRTVGRLAWIEIKLLLREPLTLVFSLALPVILLFVLGSVFGNKPSAPGQKIIYRGIGATDYYVPAYVALVVAAVCVISMPAHLAGYRERGVLKRYRASSLRRRDIAGAEFAVAIALSAVSATILLIAAAAAYNFKGPQSVPGVIATFLYLAVGFGAFGLLLGALLPTARSAQAAGMLIWFVMLFLGGAGPAARGPDRPDACDTRVNAVVVRGADAAGRVAGPRSGPVVVGLHRRDSCQRRARPAPFPLGVGPGRPR